MADVTFDVAQNRMEVHDGRAEPWRITLVDTGPDTMTGGRLGRVRKYVEQEDFCLTYGDGVSDVDIGAVIAQHQASGLKATVTAVKPPGRFGALEIVEKKVHSFQEKPMGDGGWINGGFFVLKPSVFGYLNGDATVWEREPLEGLARDRQLGVYQHEGFWQAMDTLRDKRHLEDLWQSGEAPWKTWA
jgi:glucose-1-phosphate cytidylyltransferase